MYVVVSLFPDPPTKGFIFPFTVNQTTQFQSNLVQKKR